MEISTAFDLMGRDIAELGSWFPVGTLVIVMTLALPVAALAMAVQGHRAAWLSVLVAVLVLGSWFLYYATDWWANPGQGSWVAMAAATVLGWAILAAALLSRRSRRSTDGGSVASPS